MSEEFGKGLNLTVEESGTYFNDPKHPHYKKISPALKIGARDRDIGVAELDYDDVVELRDYLNKFLNEVETDEDYVIGKENG